MSWYVDSSAILAIIFGEGTSKDFSHAIRKGAITSELSKVEVLRNVTKVDPGLIVAANRLLDQFDFIEISKTILKRASEYPHEIRSKTLDAIHLATAESFQPLIEGIITFDKQMAQDARHLKLHLF